MTDFDRDFPGWRDPKKLTPAQEQERDERCGWPSKPEPRAPKRGLYDELGGD